MSQQGKGSTVLNVALKDLNPWVPDIDLRRSDKPQIINGSNFIDGIDGPYSAFSSSFTNDNYWDAATRGRIDSLRIANGLLYGTQTGVWYIDSTSGKAVQLLNVSTAANPQWPWTIAYVGGFYYLAQYNIGLWQYDPVNLTLTKVTTPVGDSISWVAASFGRLIFLGPTVVGISALDDGTNLTPDLATAAGAQPLSIVDGSAMGIVVIPDGFLVYMTQGMIKATFTQNAYVFEYKSLTKGIQLFSPNAATYIPRVGALSLDETGFNLTREYNYQDYGIPQPWEITMGDFVKKNIIVPMNKNLLGAIDVFYCLPMQLLFISFSSNSLEGTMSSTFVFSIINKKWGSFNHVNTGIFETYDPVSNTYWCGYISTDGYMRQITSADFSEDFPNQNPTLIDYLYRPLQTDNLVLTTNPAGTVIQVGSSDMKFSDNPPWAYNNYTASGLYYMNYTPASDTMNDNNDDPNWNAAVTIGGTYINADVSGGIELIAFPLVPPQIGINSSLQVGPFRFSDQTQADQTSAIATIMIGVNALSGFIITEDWNTEIAPAEDWNSLSGTEDWGFGASAAANYDLTLTDTNDGINSPIQGDEILPVFEDLGSAQIFKPIGYSSIYHNLLFEAVNPGESFAIKTVDATGLLTGILQNT